MCGIAGFVSFQGNSDNRQFEDMTRLIAHRGPDDEGYLLGNMISGKFLPAGGGDTPASVFQSGELYAPKNRISAVDNNGFNLALSNRRLAILDLSPAGHQPMTNEKRSAWVVFNGEIYNYKEIRAELIARNHRFFSDSDTEVVLKAYEEWGFECLKKFNGMWAICLWDLQRQILFCARDRLGVKPFYYFHDGRTLAFSSEIKSLLCLLEKRDVNETLMYDFLKFGMLDHTDDTFFEGVRKLPPAHYMVVRQSGEMSFHRYWDLEVSDEIVGREETGACRDDFLELFTDAVRLRLRSDVPVGSCLSGGLDSSSIVCVANGLLQSCSGVSATERQKTFSSCFEDRRFDEREYIEEVLNKTHAERNYIFPQPEGFTGELDRLLWHQEEPFAGASIYGQWCVIKKVRERGVVVLLDGQGGDEQLAGYRKFYVFYLMKLLRTRQYARFMSEALQFSLSPEILKTLNMREGLRYFRAGDKMLGVEGLLSDGFRNRFGDRRLDFGFNLDLGARMRADLFQFSLPVLLRYEDKNSMAHSVEARLPFLDYRLVEKIASFPLSQKMKNGWTKYVLRKALSGVLPEKIARRKSKLGFVTPEDIWFREVIAKKVLETFEKAIFLGNYVNQNALVGHFKKYLEGQSFYRSDIFFRFYILELWARKFLLPNRAGSANPTGAV